MSTENTDFEPRIAAFLCNWCSYGRRTWPA